MFKPPPAFAVIVLSDINRDPDTFTPPPTAPVTVTPEIAADFVAPTVNTLLAPFPPTVSRVDPGPVIVVVAASLNDSWPVVSVMILDVLKKLEKRMTSAVAAALESETACRSDPE